MHSRARHHFIIVSILNCFLRFVCCLSESDTQIAVSTPDVFDAAAAVEKTKYDVSASPALPLLGTIKYSRFVSISRFCPFSCARCVRSG